MDTGAAGKKAMRLAETQAERYRRQIALAGVGAAGQEKILRAKVLVAGVGGLGSPAALYLAAAGVGTIGLADPDRVELSNLNRQVIHASADIGRAKTSSASGKLRALNPDVRVREHRLRLAGDETGEIVAQYDFIVDATDNFAAKFLVNDACVGAGKPFVHAGILGFGGQVLTWLPGHACYRCLFREPPPPGAVPGGSRAPVIGVTPGLVGVIEAAEALRFILGRGRLLTGRLLTVNLLDMEFRTIAVRRRPDCPACGGVSPGAAGGEVSHRGRRRTSRQIVTPDERGRQ